MRIDQIVILTIFTLMLIQMTAFGILIKKNNLSLSGVPPISKITFKLGKAAMFFSWVAIIVQGGGLINLSLFRSLWIIKAAAVFILICGWFIQLISYCNLGKNLKFGIPDHSEEKAAVLKKDGIYSICRNPMYLGFFMIQLSIVLYVRNPVIWLFSGFTFYVHHKIVLKEEVFLNERFGTDWLDYSAKVRRYLPGTTLL